MSDPENIVIVGANLAGGRAAETLRHEGYAGRIVLVGEEPDRPYGRLPLSKEQLRGPFPEGKVFLSARDAVFARTASQLGQG